MYREKIINLIEVLQKQDNADQKIAMVYRLLETAGRYVTVVCEHMWKANSLISLIKSVNRLCENNGLPRLYEGADERRQMGDFAFELVEEYFRNRI